MILNNIGIYKEIFELFRHTKNYNNIIDYLIETNIHIYFNHASLLKH